VIRSSLFRVSGLLLIVLTTPSLPAQRGGRGGADNVPTPSAAELIVHGSVALPDGVVPRRLVRVEKLCGGRVEATTYADSRGRFSFSLGLMESGPASFGQGTSSPTTSSISGTAAVAAAQSGGASGKVVTANDVKDCSVRASLTGYHPPSLALEPVVKNQNTSLGELSFRPLGKQENSLLSATDAAVPANAKKEYEKGLDDIARSKWKDGTSAIEKAASGYAKYATAWLSLGMLQEGQKETAAAFRSYAKAIAADENFAPAYVELADLEATSGQWDKVIEHTNKAIALDPDAFGRAYYLNAMANIRLNQYALARKSVAEGRVDPDHEYPDLTYIDGVLVMTGGDDQGARKRFESYVAMAPDGTNAAQARKLLSELAPK
jgi:tetratricopeptide (TPR) repeat protein